ncbi:MAG: lysine--tRNA ligase [Bacteriovoracaceae bacterium]
MADTPTNTEVKLIHWADMTAQRIIKQKGDRDSYTLASGITPSGVVHFGNFREVITVDFVARALRARGKNVRFIFSWDDYDTFRKIPVNLPKQELLQEYLFHPIVDTPDPFEEHESYAAHHEANFEKQLEKVGVAVEPLYQAKKYRNGEYKDFILVALKNTDKIKDILNQHRTSPLDEKWHPVSVYCPLHKTDKTQVIGFDGESKLTYVHTEQEHEGTIDLNNPEELKHVKLPWRVDWPMRWSFEKVDFEPGGKDHSSQGGSYDTAKDIVKLYDWEAPIYLQYDFVSIKGAGGKMSSSKGNLITVNDVLKVYEPEMVRWIFASYKSNVDFAVSFDLDVIKTYEDFDRQERLAFGVDQGNEKKVAMAKRVYQLSQIQDCPELTPENAPMQPSFRHLCNVLQINDGDIEKAKVAYNDQIKTERDQRRFNERSLCALHWLENYAPVDFKFKINPTAPTLEISELGKNFIKKLSSFLEVEWDNLKTDKELHEELYKVIHEVEIEPSEAFLITYNLLISRDKGPKLAGFMRSIGKERILNLLNSVA